MPLSLTTIPLEILSEICLWLDGKSLKRLRSTGKLLGEVGRQHIFRRVHAPLELKHHKLMSDGGPTYIQGRLSDRQSPDAASETVKRDLQEFISRLKNLEEVTFLYGNPNSEPTKSPREFNNPGHIKEPLASIEGDGGLDSSHIDAPREYENPEDWVTGYYHAERSNYGHDEFTTIHNALTTSNAKIRLLRIRNLGSSFFTPSKNISFESWSLLTRLELSLVDDFVDDEHAEVSLQKGLKLILQNFEKLRYLRISWDTHKAIPFDSVLESSFIWPHLKALCLGGFSSTEEGLKMMIAGNIMSQVGSLCLRAIDLSSNSDVDIDSYIDMVWERSRNRIEAKFPTYHLIDLPYYEEDWEEGNCPFCFE
ncbi:unnamed protein product [Clonostachys rosea f. rosea IK726]|uniref:Uncharacterized protein n=1 Tax=Clonostachys rosea f. rosea IK726 TaxID=1349383 RepID=A0ACA9TES6_BIOOC|nr:unnamed protein product [Clonostachys rosea f. rosea IK726]